MRNRIKIAFLSAFALLAVGCATGYKETLERYERAEPLDYYQRAIELAETDTPSSPTMENLSFPEALAVPAEDKLLEMASDFFQLSAVELENLFKDIRNENALVDDLTFNELVLAVALHNPSVVAARHRWEAALRQYSQAEFLENLVAGFHSFTKTLNIESGKSLHNGMTRQFTPGPGTMSLKGELVQQQVRLAEIEWQMALREAVVESGKAYFEYQYLMQAEKTMRENIDLLEGDLKVVEQRYRSGTGSQAYLLRAQTEVERQRNRLDDLRSRMISTKARINAALNRPADAKLGEPRSIRLSIPGGELSDEALMSRQEVQMQEARVARMEAAIRLAEAMNRPLPGEGFSRFERGMTLDASEGESEMSFGGMRKEKDRPAFAQEEAYILEMRDKLAALYAGLDGVNAETRARAMETVQALDIALREAELIRGVVVPQTRSAYDTTLPQYASGGASFVDLTEVERAFINARLEVHEAERSVNQAVLEFARVRGVLPLED